MDILEVETKNTQNNKIFIDIMKKINRTQKEKRGGFILENVV